MTRFEIGETCVIQCAAFALSIRTVRPTDFRAFFPLESEPTQILQQWLELRFLVPCFVGIFNAQNKTAARFAGREITQERSACIAQMQRARRAGRKAGGEGFG